MKGILFFWRHFSLWAVRRCTAVAPVRLEESSQQQLSPRFHSTFILCCNYSRGLGALWAFSGGATPSTESESILTIFPRCVHYTFKKIRKRWWCTAKMLSLSLPLPWNSTAERLLFFFNSVLMIKYSLPVTIRACRSLTPIMPLSKKSVLIQPNLKKKTISTTNPHFLNWANC